MDLKQMNNHQFLTLLRRRGACPDAVRWVSEHGGTPEQIFRDCDRGDWIGWFIRENLTELGYTIQDWARALGAALTPDHPELGRALKRYSRGEIFAGDLIQLGFPLGLSADLNFPTGRWTFMADTADVFRQHFPLFGKE